MSYGITHKETYVEEHRGYHGGEGFGGKEKILDDITYSNVAEGFQLFIEEQMENEEFSYDVSWTFDKCALQSENEDTGEEEEIELPNENITKKEMIEIFQEEVNKRNPEKIRENLEIEKKYTIELTQRDPEIEKQTIYESYERIEIKTKYNPRIEVMKSELKDQDHIQGKIDLQMDTFANGGDEEYYRAFYEQENNDIKETKKILNQSIKDTKEKIEIEISKIKKQDKYDESIEKVYNRRQKERFEDIKKLESLINIIKPDTTKKVSKKTKINKI